jgi:hypothetical protein
MRAAWLVVAMLSSATLFLSACRKSSTTVARALPGVTTGSFAELSASELSVIVVCHDTLGRPRNNARMKYAEMQRCAPCMPNGISESAERSIAHARRLWRQTARAPYDSLDMGANCTRLSYRFARAKRPDDDSLAVEIALVHLASAEDSVRATALARLDSLIGQRVTAEQTHAAAHLLAQLATGIWDRAQRQLERPRDLDVHELERSAHRLDRGAPVLRYLPAIPRASSELGVSEGVWAARLFESAARLTARHDERSRWLRLSLAPWVAMEDWAALDSAAGVLLRFAPNDSAVLPARALSAYRRMRHPVLESPAIMAQFDSALARLPRGDSLRYDSFDGMLTAEDDHWRYGFLPDERMALDRRGWAVLDPLWSTPVNELRLARRARVAEADYRHADIALRDEAGSETMPGQILVRRGSPSPRWSLFSTLATRQIVVRSWPNMAAYAEINRSPDTEDDEAWRAFYGPQFSLKETSRYLPSERCTVRQQAFPSLHSCVTALRSEWEDVPFYGKTDAIDVTVARFRAPNDSADMYIGARVPLRAFKSRDDLSAQASDRIDVGLWLTNEWGVPIVHQSVRRELPAPNVLAWTHQWSARVGSLRMMHRVEAMEPTKPSGARGIARFTSDAQVAFPVRGFGMSDVLVAAQAKSGKDGARRWRDLTIEPNGATITPRVRFAMVWEVYDLTPGADGRVRWRVRLKRERGAVVVRDDMKEVLAGTRKSGSRVVAAEDDAPDISYVRDAAPTAAILENILFGLDDAPPGQHVVNVTIDDLVSGKSVTRGVSVRVLVPDSQKRGTPIGSPFATTSRGAAGAPQY